MDEVDGMRARLFPEDSELLLAPFTNEHGNVEDDHAELRADLECDAQDLKAESWSVVVDQDYLKDLPKEAVKRQDVIYEFIKTEMHYVRTLKILSLYMHELKEGLQMDEARLVKLFPDLDILLALHQHFLSCLKTRRQQALEEGSPNNYLITQLADVLISQFSGDLGERMKEVYGVFCSHHNDALSFYKDQLQNNKKFQNLIKKIGQWSIVRRLGVPDCFMLMTQRISKYPVLVERIIQNTEANTEEHGSLVQALAFIEDTIMQVDVQVDAYEKTVRLRDISLRLEPKSRGYTKDGRFIRREDLVTRTLLQEATLTWKAPSGKHKDILVVLLSDVLLLLQEKDQKLFFASMDKPPVVSLQRLIVREVAKEDKGMFLICASSSKPEMYELYAGSRKERDAWMGLIRHTVDRCSDGEEVFSEDQDLLDAKVKEHKEFLRMKDVLIVQSLTEKLQAFTDFSEAMTGVEAPQSRLLLRGDDIQQRDTILKEAVTEVENLQSLVLSRLTSSDQQSEGSQGQGGLLRRAETFAGFHKKPPLSPMENQVFAEWPVGSDGGHLADSAQRSASNPDLREISHSESLELSVDTAIQVAHCNCSSNPFPNAELYYMVLMLSEKLYSLQATLALQDSQTEARLASLLERPGRPRSHVLLEQEKQRNLEKQKEEMASFQRLQEQQRQEQQRWEKERERHRAAAQAEEASLQSKEEECRRLEERLTQEKEALEEQKRAYQQDLERLRDAMQKVEKEKERLDQQMKLKKHMSMTHNPGYYKQMQEPSQLTQSFRGDALTSRTPSILVSVVSEVPPMVPPRKESIIPPPVKEEVPIHLISTTNQAHKPGAVQQKIPTKLAAGCGKGKEKSPHRKAHHHRAASIDMSQVVPIKVTGKEGGSLRAKRAAAPKWIYPADYVNPDVSRSVSNAKPTHMQASEGPPPVPPPFPKDLKRQEDTVLFF